jgi:hypothetical protein
MIGLIVALIVVGVLLWAVESLIPMDATIRRVIQVVVVLCVLLYILRFFGLI